jgi:hypothetical protein
LAYAPPITGDLLISNGENVKVTQTQLRHTTPKITLDLYAQAVSADQQKAHKKVVQMVFPKKLPEKLKAKNVTTTAKNTVGKRFPTAGCPGVPGLFPLESDKCF